MVKVEGKLKLCKECGGSGLMYDGGLCPECEGNGYVPDVKFRGRKL